MELAPEQFASLKRILNDPVAKAAAALNRPASGIEAVFKTLEAMSRKCAAALGEERLLILHVPGQNGGRVWGNSAVESLIQANTKVITVGDDGTIIGARPDTTSIVAAAEASDNPPNLAFLCAAGQLCVFAAGKPIAEIGVKLPPIERCADLRRPWREIKSSLNEHFSHCIQSEKGCRYWHDRRRRILLAGPDGTEKIFHHNLFWWCNNFINDALDVFGETQGMGQDKTDITIVTEAGSIVIEVKWLGRNESNTRYAQIRINEGMLQVADYLNRNPRLMTGYVVIYDARSDEEHRTESTYPIASRHEKCHEPLVYFLRSETPSEHAVRVAAEAQT